MLANFLKRTWELSAQEWVVLLSVAAWVILRVAGVVVKEIREGGHIHVRILGKEVIDVHREQPEKEKIPVTGV
jgi:hypothetical protein